MRMLQMASRGNKSLCAWWRQPLAIPTLKRARRPANKNAKRLGEHDSQVE